MLNLSDAKTPARKAGTPFKKGGISSRKKKPARSLDYEKIIRRMGRLKPPYMNFTLLCAVICIALFGLAMVYSASWYNSRIYHGTKYHYFTSQLIGFVLGIVLMAAAYIVDYRIYKKWAVAFYIIAAVLLILVFVPGIGITRLGSSRWIGVGGFSMQPSEIAKFAFIIFAAAIATRTSPVAPKGASTPYFKGDSQKVFSLKKTLLIASAGLAYCAFILLEPNLSITLCMGMTMFIMLFLCGARLKHLAVIAAPALVALPVMLVAEPYRVRRLLAFIDPWARPKDEGFQLIQSLFGLGNGGLFGVGYGNSTQKHMFLPFAESDFIFSIIGEEFGFIGSVLFLAVLGLIVTQIFRVGIRCPDRFGKYICYGIATVIFVQSAVNLAVVTGSIPPTGVPLPFISFGGTSLAVCMAAVGVVLNIDKRTKILDNKHYNGI